MYPVSSGYLNAVRSKVRTDRVTGTIVLSDSTSITINDSVLVKDTLKLTRGLCSGKYRIGTFDLACLRFGFFIDNALGLDLTGAYVTLSYGICVNGEFEDVPLGKFLIDPVLSVRRKDILNIVAYDEGVRFDVPLSDTLRESEGTPAELILAACAQCGVGSTVSASSVSAFPNNALTVSAGDKQIQTCRDLVVWCAALMCCYAAVDRSSRLTLIPAKYAVQPEDQTVIITDRAIRADERENITVTDTRAYIKYLTAYSGDDVKSYTSSYVSDDEQASPASYVLEKNPLLAGKTAAECDTANAAWLSYIGAFKQRGVRAEIFGDPSPDVGDTIAFLGGDVDQRSGIIGVVTGLEWRYRGCTDIECLAAECRGSLTSAGSTYFSSDVRSQSEKRIDGLRTGGEGVGEFTNDDHNSERFNDYENNTISGGSYNTVKGTRNALIACYATSADGYGNTVAGTNRSSVSGENNTVGGCETTHVSGYNNNVTRGSYHTVGGNGNTVIGGVSNNVSGQSNQVTNGSMNLVAGMQNTVTCSESSVVGEDNTVSGNMSVVAGTDNTVSAARTVTCGSDNINSKGSSMMCGYYGNNADNLFAIGNGTSSSDALCFYVTESGAVYAAGSYNTIGADYAEYFEWADGNPGNEDRRGMLVRLEGDKIVPADSDEILGAVSSRPSVVGNSCEEHWRGKYKTDVFGDYILDENGERMLSEGYDKGTKYIPRSQRQEWAAVGLVGRLIVNDSGKCSPGGHITARNGIAVPTRDCTNVRMLRRGDDTHNEVLIR